MAKHAGYMTVELLITLIVGAMLVISLNTVFVSHSHLAQRSRNIVMVNSFAEHKIEALRSAGYLSLTDSTTNITSELPADLQKPKSASLQVSSYTANIKKIYLSVTYHDTGASRTQTYTTYIGELGVGQL